LDVGTPDLSLLSAQAAGVVVDLLKRPNQRQAPRVAGCTAAASRGGPAEPRARRRRAQSALRWGWAGGGERAGRRDVPTRSLPVHSPRVRVRSARVPIRTPRGAHAAASGGGANQNQSGAADASKTCLFGPLSPRPLLDLARTQIKSQGRDSVDPPFPTS